MDFQLWDGAANISLFLLMSLPKYNNVLCLSRKRFQQYIVIHRLSVIKAKKKKKSEEDGIKIDTYFFSYADSSN